ncbi:hypothetical protein VULLAG_LOCUS1711 [Vulpes lagopus]
MPVRCPSKWLLRSFALGKLCPGGDGAAEPCAPPSSYSAPWPCSGAAGSPTGSNREKLMGPWAGVGREENLGGEGWCRGCLDLLGGWRAGRICRELQRGFPPEHAGAGARRCLETLAGVPGPPAQHGQESGVWARALPTALPASSSRPQGAQRSGRGSRGQQVGERPPVLGQKGRASEVSLHPVRRSSAPGTGISWQRQFKSRLASYPQSMLWWKQQQQQQQEEKWEKAVIKKHVSGACDVHTLCRCWSQTAIKGTVPDVPMRTTERSWPRRPVVQAQPLPATTFTSLDLSLPM